VESVEIWSAAGLVLYGVASLVAGIRLLALATRTWALPELSLGAGLVVGVVAGYVPETVVLATDWAAPAAERGILAVTQVAIRLAALAILFFTWRVFRPDETWALWVFGILVGALVVSWVGFPLTQIHALTLAERVWYEVFAVARSACLAWGALESFRCWRTGLRRGRLGLSDPLVTNRFLLWSIALGASALLMGSTIWAGLAGVDPSSPAWVLLESLFGSVGAVGLWLTFFPSDAYRRRIERRRAS